MFEWWNFSENVWHALQKSLALLGNVASRTRLLKGFLFYIMGSYVRNLKISIPYNLLIARQTKWLIIPLNKKQMLQVFLVLTDSPVGKDLQSIHMWNKISKKWLRLIFSLKSIKIVLVISRRQSTAHEYFLDSSNNGL